MSESSNRDGLLMEIIFDSGWPTDVKMVLMALLFENGTSLSYLSFITGVELGRLAVILDILYDETLIDTSVNIQFDSWENVYEEEENGKSCIENMRSKFENLITPSNQGL